MQSALSPILRPPDHTRPRSNGTATGVVDLGQDFPAGGCEGSGKDVVAMGYGIFRCPPEPEFEAGNAAWTALRSFDNLSDRAGRAFHNTAGFYEIQPGVVVIFIIRDFQSEGGGVAGELVAALDIFIKGNDIRVAEKEPWPQAFVDHPFKDGGRAWSAAAMKQDAVPFQITPFRKLRFESTALEMLHPY